jgi:type II secretory pathway pseudopilin PulG
MRAMTLLETLAVVVIIGILIGILMVGMKYFSRPGRVAATKVAMENARAMASEYEAVKGRGALPTAIIDTPGQVDEFSEPNNGRNNSAAVYIAQDMVYRMRRTAANGTVFAKLPTRSIGHIKGARAPLPSASSKFVPSKAYSLNAKVSYNSANFVCVKAMTASGSVAPPDTRYWKFVSYTQSWWPTGPVYGGEGPLVLLDGWDNPLIYATRIDFRDSGGTVRRSIAAPDSRPFWASAGDDGDFGRWDSGKGDVVGGDDNLYSFEN